MEQIIRFAGVVTRRLSELDDDIDRPQRRALRASLVELERDARLTLDVLMVGDPSVERHLGALGHHLITRVAQEAADAETAAVLADDLDHVAQLFSAVDEVPPKGSRRTR
jgi:DNA-binding HxlR family transcriptional regulator